MHMNATTSNNRSARTPRPFTWLLACLIIATSVTVLTTPQARAANDASCAPLMKAQTALQQASTILETVTLGSRPPFKLILTPTRMYTQGSDGSWTYAEMSMATRKKVMHLFGKSQLTDCRLLRSEKLDGQAADVYTVTVDPRFGKKSTVTVWVSKASGLPLRNEGDVHKLLGGTEHMVQQFSYKNVHVPANAKEEGNMNRMFGH